MKPKIEKKFRIRSKKFFLTYPKVVNLPNVKELFLVSIWKTFGVVYENEVEYIIVRQLHQDGIPDIHIYLEFKEEQAIYSRAKLHVTLTNNDGEDIVQEGQYQGVRRKESVIEYILKNVQDDYLTNMF